MKVQDFFSVVQLGVGFHVGSAILQLSGELGVSPRERRIENIAGWLEQERDEGNILVDPEADLKDLKSQIYVFKTGFASLYRALVLVNSGFAAFLVACLSCMSFYADTDLPKAVGSFLVAVSMLPAPASFGYLWIQVTKGLQPIDLAISRLESGIKVSQGVKG